MFWLENVPLNGTNQITLQATNAAGTCGLTTNFTVYPSTIQLTIDQTPTGDDLYKPTGSVSGTVSDPTATVTVNGTNATVQATANTHGTYNWTAPSAPINGLGTATFDVQATPAASGAGGGGPPANVAAVVEMDAFSEIVYHTAEIKCNVNAQIPGMTIKDREVWTKDYANIGSTNYDGNLFDFENGWVTHYYEATNTGNGSFSWSEADFVWTFWDAWSQFEATYYQPPVVVPGLPLNYFPDITSVPDTWRGRHYRADKAFYYWLWHNYGGWVTQEEMFYVKALTEVKLYTGGKSGVNRQNLFGATCWAEAYHQVGSVDVLDVLAPTPIANSKLLLGSLGKVGADGKVWKVLPDNAPGIDFTVQAPGIKHFNADATQQKYKLQIGVSTSVAGTELEPDEVVPGANFCVGQYLTFSPAWSPAAPPYVAGSSFHWGLPGHFYNTEAKPCPTCSTDPDVDVNKLGQEVASGNWWVSGGNPKEYKASVGMNLVFPNGQKVFISSRGKFTMFRPTAEILTLTTSVNVFSGHYLWFFQDVVHPGIKFIPVINCPEIFLGSNSTNWLQVVFNTSSLLLDALGTVHYQIQNGASPYLDGADPYNVYVDGRLADSPGLNLDYRPNGVSGAASASFKMWLLFQPKGGGHLVPLEAVNWQWSGIATNSASGWDLLSGTNSQYPTGSPTEGYPVWKSNVNDNHWAP